MPSFCPVLPSPFYQHKIKTFSSWGRYIYFPSSDTEEETEEFLTKLKNKHEHFKHIEYRLSPCFLDHDEWSIDHRYYLYVPYWLHLLYKYYNDVRANDWLLKFLEIDKLPEEELLENVARLSGADGVLNLLKEFNLNVSDNE